MWRATPRAGNGAVAMALEKIDYGPERKFVLDGRLHFPDWLGLIAIVAAPAVVLVLLLPLPLAPPVISLLSFVSACGFALYALATNANRDARGASIWNIAWAFAVIWIVAGLMSKPRHVLDWFESLSTMT
jgi:hypothetical protein